MNIENLNDVFQLDQIAIVKNFFDFNISCRFAIKIVKPQVNYFFSDQCDKIQVKGILINQKIFLYQYNKHFFLLNGRQHIQFRNFKNCIYFLKKLISIR